MKKVRVRFGRLFTLAAVVLLTGLLTAGGPLLTDCRFGLFCTDTPFVHATIPVPFNPDQGNLGLVPGPGLDNVAAVAATEAAFAAWEAIPTASISYINAGSLPVDVDETNFFNFLFVFDGLSPIVFDENGAIFSLLFGPGSGIIGFAGAEVVDLATNTFIEALAFLNGEFLDGDPLNFELTVAEMQAVFVHEFGHINGLAHSVVNGQAFLLGEDVGSGFGIPPETSIETMYAFLVTQEQATPHADDIAIISTLYPEPGFFAATGAIEGTIFDVDGQTPLCGVNVIVRNPLDPFNDAVSFISGGFNQCFGSGESLGRYTVNGLTDGANYRVEVDQIRFGRFSTPPIFPFPGPKEFYSGMDEGCLNPPDDPTVFVPVLASAGSPATGVDIIFNVRLGVDLGLFDDDSREIKFGRCPDLPLASLFFQGRSFTSIWVNSNGSITFGLPDFDFTESVGDFLSGPPRIAPLWDDLNPFAAGEVIPDLQQPAVSELDLTITWTGVPEFPNVGSNTFKIILHENGTYDVEYGAVSAPDGLAGFTSGLGAADPGETDLSAQTGRIGVSTVDDAVYEIFRARDNDLANLTLNFFDVATIAGTAAYYGPGAVGVPGVDVKLSGAFTDATATEAQGNYQFADLLQGPGYVVSAAKSGDLNGHSALDAAHILQNVVELREFNSLELIAADPTGDGTVSALDATFVLQCVVGIKTEADCAQWLLFPDARGVESLLGGVDADFIAILLGDVTGNWAPAPPPSPVIAGRTATPLSADEDAAGGDTVMPSMAVGLARRDGEGRVVVPVEVETVGKEVLALDADLSYDPKRLEFERVEQIGPAADFQVMQHMPEPGDLRIALAGTEPAKDDGAYLRVVFKDSKLRSFDPSGVRLERARVNEWEVIRAEEASTPRAPKPTVFTVSQNYPNPFNDRTGTRLRIDILEDNLLALSGPGKGGTVHVVVEIFNVRGQLVRRLLDADLQAGSHTVKWDCRNERGQMVSSGLYVARVQAGPITETRKMLMLRGGL